MAITTHQPDHHCEQVVATLSIPDPFDVQTFVAQLSAQRARPLRLRPASPAAAGLCGIPAVPDEIDYLYYPATSTPQQAVHLVVHQVGHLLLGHTVDADVGHAAPEGPEQTTLQLPLPDLSPTLIGRIVGQTPYLADQERQADLFATRVLARGQLLHVVDQDTFLRRLLDLRHLMDGDWIPDVLLALSTGPRRYTELLSTIWASTVVDGWTGRDRHVQPRIFVETLRRMESDGLIHRSEEPNVCPRVVRYALTAAAGELLSILIPTVRWCEQHNAIITEGQRRCPGNRSRGTDSQQPPPATHDPS